jgi:hypothetical protein
MSKVLTWFVAGFLVLACFTGAGCEETAKPQPQPEKPWVKLQMKFVPGQLYRYKLEVTTTSALQSEDLPAVSHTAVVTAIIRERTKSILPDGQAQVALAYESLKMNLDGVESEVPATQIPTVVTQLSSAGALEYVPDGTKIRELLKIPDYVSVTLPTIGDCYVPLSGRPMKLGDTWSTNVSADQSPVGLALRTNYEIIAIGEKVNNQVVTSIIRRTEGGSLKPLAGSGSNAVAGNNGRVEMSDLMRISEETGRLVSRDAATDTAFAKTIEVPPLKKSVNVLTIVKNKMHLDMLEGG